jgi:hypothetical protein
MGVEFLLLKKAPSGRTVWRILLESTSLAELFVESRAGRKPPSAVVALAFE